MKKSSRLLVILLVIATLATVFTVVTLASDSALPSSHSATMVGKWEDKTSGTFIGVNSETRHGNIYAEVADNGNCYGVWEPKTGTSETNFVEPYLVTTMNSDNTYKYNVSDYPYMSFDFDVMTPTGVFFNAANFNFRLHHTTARDGSNKYIGFPLAFNVEKFSPYVDNTPYTWSHVTVVMEHILTTDPSTKLVTSANLCYNYYINGEKAYSETKSSSSFTGRLPVDFGYIQMRLNASSGSSTTQKTAVDNFRISYFTRDFGSSEETKIDEMVATVYNDSYVLPYGKTVATVERNGSTLIFDSLTKAIDAAAETEVIKLTDNITDVPVISKPVIIDANVLDENGDATGEFYSFTYKTEGGYLPEYNNGIYSFSLNARKVTVNWDPTCEKEECDCFVGNIGHIANAVSEASLGTLPIYPKDVPVLDAKDGFVITHIGWSYENDGTVDVIKEITEADIERGVLNIYPVYEGIQYSLEVKSPSGESEFFLESDLAKAFSKAIPGSTILLHTDVISSEQITSGKALTLDLNGHSYVHRALIYNDYEAIDDGEGGFTKAETPLGVTEISVGTAAFRFTSSGFVFTITSSKPGATLVSCTVSADRLMNGDEVVAIENEKVYDYNTLFNLYPSNSTYNLLGENITFYTEKLFYAEHGSNNSTLKINVDGGVYNIFSQPHDGAFAIRRGGDHVIKNATFFANGSYLYRTGSYEKNNKITFIDCDIIGATALTYDDTDVVTFKNCRVDMAASKTCVSVPIFDYGTMLTASSWGNVTSGNFRVTYNTEKTYSQVTALKIDPETKLPTVDTTEDKILVFTGKIANIENECTHVVWIDDKGNFLAESYEYFNSTATAPSVKVPLGDGWRAITNITEWLDEDGKTSDLKLADESEYVFTAVIPPLEEQEYASYMTGAMFNMTYFTSLSYNVYVPKDEKVQVTVFGENAPSRTVLIDGVEYWVYTVYVSANDGLNGLSIPLEYFIDGKKYETGFRPSALFYSTAIVTDPSATDKEKEAVGCLIRFIEESCNALAAANGGTIDAKSLEKLESFYSLYTPKEYTNDYPDADMFDDKAFTGLLGSVHLEIYSSNVRFVFTITPEAYALGYTAEVNGLGSALLSEVVTNSNGVETLAFKTEMLPLRTHVMQPFELYIADSGGEIVTVDGKAARSYYSLAAYTSATNNVLAKSLYAFGEAVLEYHPLSNTRYPIDKITLFGEDIKDYTIAADVADTAEYRAAQELQALIYAKSGYWLRIVSSSEAGRSIVITLAENTGGLGFEAIFSEGRIDFICEYESVIESSIIELFNKKIALATDKTLSFNGSDSTVKNVRDIYYSDFGAVGDGINDDSEAIRAAHLYANKYGHTVYADPNATYVIGPLKSAIIVRTNVNWGNATFKVDDSVIPFDAPERTVQLFSISKTYSGTSFTANNEYVKAINESGGINASEITKLDLGLGYPAMLKVTNADHNNYIRFGPNQNAGSDQVEIIIIDENGNIDPSTPFMFDYEKLTNIVAYRLDDKPITIEGGVFNTIANCAPCDYTAYARGLSITRSNVTVRNVQHYVSGEGATGAPYGGFMSIQFSHNTLIEDCIFTSHKTYYYIGSGGTNVGMGSYDITPGYSVNLTFKNCTQSNFFNSSGSVVSGNWGIMGSSYCKNLTYDGCVLTRFDAHAGIYNATILNSTLQHLSVVGAGTVRVENTHVYNNLLANLRTDYGNFWHGDFIIKDVTMHTSSAITLFGATWYNHDFGYPTALPTNITVDGLKTTGTNKTVHLFSSGFVTLSDNIILEDVPGDGKGAFTDKDGNPITKPNINKMSATKSVTIKNNTQNLDFVIPDGATYKFFADMIVTRDDIESEE